MDADAGIDLSLAADESVVFGVVEEVEFNVDADVDADADADADDDLEVEAGENVVFGVAIE